MVKKAFSLLIGWLLILTMPAALAATIEPMEPFVKMDDLANQAVLAVIKDFNVEECSLTVELYTPEVFAEDDILNLEVGDIIVSQNKEHIVETITEDFPYIVINRGDYLFSDGSLWFDYDPYGNFLSYNYDEATSKMIGSLTFVVPENLLFLDGITPDIGYPLSIPTVHTASEFMNKLVVEEQNSDVGFSCNNVYIVFDAAGQPAVIHRFYVSWQ